MENEPTPHDRGPQRDRTGTPDEPRRYGTGGREPRGQGRQPPETRWGQPWSGAGPGPAEEARQPGPPPQTGPSSAGAPPPYTGQPPQGGPPPQMGPQGRQHQGGTTQYGPGPQYGGAGPGYGTQEPMSQQPPGQQPGPPGPGAGQPRPPGPERPRLRPIRTEDIVQQDVVTVQPDTPIRTAVASMAEHDVGTVVVTEDRRAVGILTDRMVALALEPDPDVADRQVADVMTGDLVTVQTGANVDELLSVLSDAAIRRVPVVDDQQRLQGIVSLDDLIVLLASQLDRVGEVVEKQSPRF